MTSSEARPVTQLDRIEAMQRELRDMLAELLRRHHARKRGRARAAGTARQRAIDRALSGTLAPTELDRARARRALRLG